MDIYISKQNKINTRPTLVKEPDMLVHGWWSITYVLNVRTTCNNWVVDMSSILRTSNCLERNCFSSSDDVSRDWNEQ
jgi:hypothetical protein